MERKVFAKYIYWGHKYYLPDDDGNSKINKCLNMQNVELSYKRVFAQNLKHGDNALLSNGKY